MQRERSPGVKLIFAGLVAAVLIVPLMMVYALVFDRENQSQQAQSQITAGWGGTQIVAGPVLVLPYIDRVTRNEEVDGTVRVVTRDVRREMYVSPQRQSVEAAIDPDRKGYAIYESVVYETAFKGEASFALTEEFAELDIEREALLLDEAELRFGVSDPRGLRDNVQVIAGGEALTLSPGNGPMATGGQGFSTPLDWTGAAPLDVRWSFAVRGSRSLGFVPRGGATQWQVTSPWPHPSFTGDFLPSERELSADGFAATYSGITNLTLGAKLITLSDSGTARVPMGDGAMVEMAREAPSRADSGPSRVAVIGLTDPVDLYSQVDRAVKYGFLFIGFTFAAFLMFDVVGGARVAAAEYLLDRRGAGALLCDAARFCRSGGLCACLSDRGGGDYRAGHGLQCRSPWHLAARGLYRRDARWAIWRAVCAAQSGDVFAGDRIGAAVRRAGGHHVCHALGRLVGGAGSA